MKSIKRTHLDRLSAWKRDLDKTNAQEIIRAFDVEFDMTMNQYLALQALRLIDAFESPNGGDIENLAIYCGACWCKIVTYDVRDEYLLARETIRESAPLAKELAEKVAEGALSSNLDEFPRYVAARWHDAAGKIFYREKRYLAANRYFKKASELASNTTTLPCLADITSNNIRNEYELDNSVGSGKPIHHYVGKLIDEIKKYKGEEDPEIRRGVAGMYQNKATIQWRHKGGGPYAHDRAIESAKESLRISKELEDVYRWAQAMFAIAHAEKEKENYCSAKRHLEQLQREKKHIGGRNLRLVQQNLAEIYAIKKDTSRAKKKFDELLSEVTDRRRLRGGDLGHDLPFHHWTIKLMEKLGLLKGNELVEHLREVIEGGRRVLDVGHYKQLYSKDIFPIYCRLIESMENRPDEQFRLVEESSGRELMDIVLSSMERG